MSSPRSYLLTALCGWYWRLSRYLQPLWAFADQIDVSLWDDRATENAEKGRLWSILHVYWRPLGNLATLRHLSLMGAFKVDNSCIGSMGLQSMQQEAC